MQSETRQHHATYFFSDGNVVLSASSGTMPSHTTLFCAHKSLLSLHSEVFRGMFEVANVDGAPGVDEIYLGRCVITMPDTSEDIECMLNAIYKPSILPFKKFDPNTPLLIGGTLAMATKYEMTEIRQRIVQHVMEDWPQTLAEWDIFEDAVLAITQYRPHDVLARMIPEPAAAISLARRYNIPEILPAAFYCLSFISPHHDWESHPKDGDSDIDDSDYGSDVSHAEQDSRTARWSLLSADDLRNYHKGLQALRKKSSEHGIWHKRTSLCKGTCRDAFEDLTKRITSDAEESDLLYALRELCDVDQLKEKKICQLCERRFIRKAEALREHVWRRLPHYFHIRD